MQEFLSTIFGVAMFLPGFLCRGNSCGTCIEMVLLTRALVIHRIYSRSQLQTQKISGGNGGRSFGNRTFHKSRFRVFGFLFLFVITAVFFLFFLFFFAPTFLLFLVL